MLYLLRLKVFVLCIVLVLVLGTSIAHIRIEDTAPDTLSNVSSLMDKAREDAKNLTLPINKYTEEGEKAARQSAEIFSSPEFQDRIQCEQQRLESEVFADYIGSWRKKEPQLDGEKSRQPGNLADSEKVYLFLSSSVPNETFHSYLADIARVEEPAVYPVMRGLVQGIGNKKANAQYFSQVLKRDPDCRDEKVPKKLCERFQVTIKMNPPLFAKYGITLVPAVVYVNDEDAFIIQGDAGLDYLLERINREAKSTTLADLIKTIQGGGP